MESTPTIANELSGKTGTGDGLVSVMVRYQQGELEGFDELYSELFVPIRNFLASLTRDFSLAEDLTQETFLRMHRSRRTYLPPRPVKPWVFGIARHVYLMDRRARFRRGRHEYGSSEDFPESSTPGAAENIARAGEVLRALDEVGEDRRRALLLHHGWGLSYREVGSRLGISESAAKLRSFRAARQVQGILESSGSPA